MCCVSIPSHWKHVFSLLISAAIHENREAEPFHFFPQSFENGFPMARGKKNENATFLQICGLSSFALSFRQSSFPFLLLLRGSAFFSSIIGKIFKEWGLVFLSSFRSQGPKTNDWQSGRLTTHFSFFLSQFLKNLWFIPRGMDVLCF